MRAITYPDKRIVNILNGPNYFLLEPNEMPNTADYTHYYRILGDPRVDAHPGYGSALVRDTTLSDTLDGSDDGVIAVGDRVDWDASRQATYLGSTSNGYPVIVDDFGDFFAISNGYPGNPLNLNETNFVMCFGAGTQIAAPNGDIKVEDLVIGDDILTADGQTVPVKWVGRKTVQKLFAGATMEPVRINAGALGNDLPHADLTVTGDHGMVIDDYVINASALVNGTTINWVPRDELAARITYYHIETDAHDVILANGAPSETFVDAVSRKNFDNYAEYLDLFGAERLIPEMKMCRITSARLLPEAIQARLAIQTLAPSFNEMAVVGAS
ncbi:MAG: hypothetical protein ACI9PY_003814 [Ascidiaceihabitans sp.]|jgi:hypothetical protein